MNKRTRTTIIAIATTVISAPFLVFGLGYTMRWVTTGQWVPGGGDRASAGILIGMLLAFLGIMACDISED